MNQASSVSAGRLIGSVLLGSLGCLSTVGALLIWRQDPSATLNPLVAKVWGTAGVTMLAVALLLLGFPRWPARPTTRSWPSQLAMWVGIVGLLAFMFLVVVHATPNRDGTMSDAALYVPATFGVLATGLGTLGIAVSRGDGPALRRSLGGLILGIGSAATPLWLWLNHPYFFGSYFRP